MKTRYQLSIFALVVGLGGFSSPLLAKDISQNFDKQVQDIFQVAMKRVCETLEPDSDLGPTTPKIFKITTKDGQEEYPGPYRLYKYPCTAGAYNFGYVYYMANGFGEIRQVQFAVPEYDVTNETDDYKSAVTGINITGFYAYDIMINPEFDEKTQTLTTFSKWRGMADASSSGQWVFKQGRFILKSYDVDASYDEKMNPVRIYGQGKPPKY